MKKIILGFICLLVLSGPSLANDHGHHGHDHAHGEGIMIEGVWSRATPKLARAGAAFMTIKNGGEDDKIIGVKASISKFVELHTHINEDGIMKMREVKEIEVPAEGMTELKPGGLHVMFIDLNAPLTEGDAFPLTIQFEKAGEKTVEVTVKKIGEMGHSHGHNHKH